MPQILVRDLSAKTVRQLKARARSGGRSLQAEAKQILERAADEPKLDATRARSICLRFRQRLEGRQFPDSSELVREDRER